MTDNGVTEITEDEIMDEITKQIHFSTIFGNNVCDDVNYIANNQLYFFDIDDQGLLYANNQPDIMNIYFVESIAFGMEMLAATHTFLEFRPVL